MAGGKKKKKPATNPARGFATTSIASKPKTEVQDAEAPSTTPKDAEGVDVTAKEHVVTTTSNIFPAAPPEKTLTAEEFELQLEEADLQNLVEKHSSKAKREALRQKTRLETDRRVLRGQAEILGTRKWLPPEIMDEILDLVKAEGRYGGQSNETSNNPKQASEEDLIIRLWTLYQSLLGAGFLEEKAMLALKHVLDISDKITSGNKDAIWGMEEALDWLCRECSRKELPDYENSQRKTGVLPKSQAGSVFPT